MPFYNKECSNQNVKYQTPKKKFSGQGHSFVMNHVIMQCINIFLQSERMFSFFLSLVNTTGYVVFICTLSSVFNCLAIP